MIEQLSRLLTVIFVFFIFTTNVKPAYAQVQIYYYPDTEYVITDGECKGMLDYQCSNYLQKDRKAYKQRGLDNSPELCESYYGRYSEKLHQCFGVGIRCTTNYVGYLPDTAGCVYIEDSGAKRKLEIEKQRLKHKELNERVRNKK